MINRERTQRAQNGLRGAVGALRVPGVRRLLSCRGRGFAKAFRRFATALLSKVWKKLSRKFQCLENAEMKAYSIALKLKRFPQTKDRLKAELQTFKSDATNETAIRLNPKIVEGLSA